MHPKINAPSFAKKSKPDTLFDATTPFLSSLPDSISHSNSVIWAFTQMAQHPEARVREMIIASLLCHPEYGSAMKFASAALCGRSAIFLKCYSTAAYLLSDSKEMPDWFSGELGIDTTATRENALTQLGMRQAELLNEPISWTGTYHHVAQRMRKRTKVKNTWLN